MTVIGYRVLEADGVSCHEYFGGPPHHTLEDILAKRPGIVIEEVEIVTYKDLKPGSLFYPKSTSSVLHQVSSPWTPITYMLGDGELFESEGGVGVIGLVGAEWNTRLVQASANVPVFKWTGREYS